MLIIFYNIYYSRDNDCAYCLCRAQYQLKENYRLMVINIIHGLSGVIKNDKNEIVKLLETNRIILMTLEKMKTHYQDFFEN